jgi:hypothetical protein
LGNIAHYIKERCSDGENKERLLALVIGVKIEDALKMENVKPTDFNGKTLKEFIFIS